VSYLVDGKFILVPYPTARKIGVNGIGTYHGVIGPANVTVYTQQKEIAPHGLHGGYTVSRRAFFLPCFYLLISPQGQPNRRQQEEKEDS
jgi:hypothetical protein